MANSSGVPSDTTVGLIGCGKMGDAIVNGLINSGAVSPNRISASRRSVDNLSHLASLGVFCTAKNSLVAQRSKVIIVAVKGYMFQGVLKEIQADITEDKIIVSVAAGLKIKKLESMVPAHTKVIRVMPNTACLVGAGASCHSIGTHASKEDGNLIKSLFSTIGICEEVPEKLINGVIGIAGSGVAYMLMALGAMADGGVKMGLTREMSQRFCGQAMLGAAKMALESKTHTEVLKDNVCSPGGTTIAAVHCLEQHGFRNALISAVETASTTATRLDAEYEKLN